MARRWTGTNDHPRQRTVSPVAWIALVLAVKLLDSTTTVVGVALTPRIEEGNPVARLLFEQLGAVGGLLLGTVLLTCMVTITTECAVKWMATTPAGPTQDHLRLIGYGTPTVISLAVALHNLNLIVLVLL